MSAGELRSIDELRILESIARDAARAPDERAEAARRLEAELAIRTGLMVATMHGAEARMLRHVDEFTAALVAFGTMAAAVVAELLAALPPAERAAVDRLVAGGTPVLDAIVDVADAGAAPDAPDRG